MELGFNRSRVSMGLRTRFHKFPDYKPKCAIGNY